MAALLDKIVNMNPVLQKYYYDVWKIILDYITYHLFYLQHICMECLVGIYAFRRTSLISFYTYFFLLHQTPICKHVLDDNRKDALIEIFPAQQCPKNLGIKSNV